MEVLASGEVVKFLRLASLQKLAGAVLKVKRSNTVAVHKNTFYKHTPDVYTIPLEPSVDPSRNGLTKTASKREGRCIEKPALFGKKKGAQTVKQGKTKNNKEKYIRFLSFRVLDSGGNR